MNSEMFYFWQQVPEYNVSSVYIKVEYTPSLQARRQQLNLAFTSYDGVMPGSSTVQTGLYYWTLSRCAGVDRGKMPCLSALL